MTDTKTPAVRPRHYDEISGGSLMLPNLNRLLVGREITVTRHIIVGPPGGQDHIDEPETFTITGVPTFTIGVDSKGVFCGIAVDGGAEPWTLYSDGTADDEEGSTRATHNLVIPPTVTRA